MEDLRLALRCLAKAVVVITTVKDGVRYAMAATAVSELSFDPPSMLVCVNQTASLCPVLGQGAPFAINILNKDQMDIANCCAGKLKGEARFEVGEWSASDLDVPVLGEAQAAIVCSNVNSIRHGTHGIFIGNVEQVILGGQPDPLVYCDGRFTAVA
ncbi:flavin reductase family protein [Novosphingobium malaysiense]|uniref:Flavin reductase domain-containing protein n=1 Tax=Novosphingobium malaysiense TaxID=1348853 RepID=A0A0B1ZME3_9SPHN|nr:flavin reductase family protein [Novosphingobium malaysiense]KHK90358.1 flavin reductase domain-containing protein [Novosphingobium malaysiense]